MYKCVEDFKHQCRERRWTVKEYVPHGTAVCDDDPWSALTGTAPVVSKASAAAAAATAVANRTVEDVDRELSTAVDRLHDVAVVRYHNMYVMCRSNVLLL